METQVERPRPLWKALDVDGKFSAAEIRGIRIWRLVLEISAVGYVAMLVCMFFPVVPVRVIMIYGFAAPFFVARVLMRIHGGLKGILLSALALITGVGMVMLIVALMQSKDAIERFEK